VHFACGFAFAETVSEREGASEKNCKPEWNMSLPVTPNNTCDIYHPGNAPPAAPDVAAVPIFLKADWVGGQEHGEGRSTINNYTHVLLMDASVDVRDNWSPSGAAATNSLYIPDKNGTPFNIIFVERVLRGTPQDHKRIYVQRQGPTWPTSNL